MRRLSILATLLVSLSACVPQPPTIPIATIQAVRNVQFSDIIRKYCDAAKLTLIQVQNDATEGSISIEVAAMEGDATQATAELAMGLMVNIVAKSTDQTKRPQILRVVVTETKTGTNKRLTLSNPALSDFLAGKISEEELVKRIQIEVKQ